MVEGKIILNDSILTEIAREAMKKVEEVYRNERKGTFAGLSGIFAERFVPQIMVKRMAEDDDDATQERIAFEVKTSIVYGVNIPEVAKKIREIVKTEVEAMTGYAVDRVDITVERLIKPEDIKKNEPDEAEDSDEE